MSWDKAMKILLVSQLNVVGSILGRPSLNEPLKRNGFSYL
jgi:hypothetical protein